MNKVLDLETQRHRVHGGGDLRRFVSLCPLCLCVFLFNCAEAVA